MATLALLSILMMTLTGYLPGLRERRYGFPTVVMMLTYATVFLLVVDLDPPVKGLFYADQEPMVQLRAGIQREMTGDPVESVTP